MSAIFRGLSAIFRRPSWQDLLKRKVISSVNQLNSSQEEINNRDTRSVFKGYYELTNLTAYFRRGDAHAYEGNFIPIWYYPVLFDKVIMFIRPADAANERTLRGYCGVGFDGLLKLIEAGLVVPLIGNNLAEYNTDTFKHFIRRLPEDKPLMRAQLFEDAFYGENGEFQKRVDEKTCKFAKILEEADASSREEYDKAREVNPLIPEKENLPQFISERVQWQELFELNMNREKMEKSLCDKSPLEAYKIARTWHYTVVPKIYSRGGFTVLAKNDDIAFMDDVGKAFSLLLPEMSKVEPPARDPIKDSEIREALNLVLSIRKHDEKKKEKERITDPNERFLTNARNACQFYDVEFLRTREKHQEESNKLQQALQDFQKRAREALGRAVLRGARLELLSMEITNIPAAFSERNFKLLRTMLEAGATIADPLVGFVIVFARACEALKLTVHSPTIHEKIEHQIQELEGSVDFPKKEGMQTPFMVLKYGCNRSPASR
ncbi:hypothetical protein M1O57_02590 [Dehalococcoidia bacterium]|nr:hypothetical protein [Dehalococcoidia bacterium]